MAVTMKQVTLQINCNTPRSALFLLSIEKAIEELGEDVHLVETPGPLWSPPITGYESRTSPSDYFSVNKMVGISSPDH